MSIRRTRLSPHKQGALRKRFVAEATARAAAESTRGPRNPAAGFSLRRRRLIAGKLPSYRLAGVGEADERYFGGTRKGRRGRGAAGKVVVFGLVKAGKVSTAIVPTAHTDTLLPILRQHVQPDSIVYPDAFRAYKALDVSACHHLRINQSSRFAGHDNPSNGIENFWHQAKRHLRKVTGLNLKHFYWGLKECAWRFNGAHHQALLTPLRIWYKHAHH